jgi:four helix bundle protein
MSDYRKLRVWHSARDLVKSAHRIASGMKGPGSVNLRDQIIRAALSIPANIVEGTAHESPREVARYVRYSISSASELEGHVQLAADLAMVSDLDLAEINEGVEAVRMMLYGLVKRLGGDQEETGSG